MKPIISSDSMSVVMERHITLVITPFCLSVSICGWLSKIHQFVKIQDAFEKREFTEIAFHMKS